MENGIVVGSDQSQEWLLSWWWDHYRRHNAHPVAFVDFGLSQAAKEWCRERGTLIRLSAPAIWVKDRDEVAPGRAEEWERRYGENFWSARYTWFKKPHACLASPFATSVWIDLDCEVVGNLEPLFQVGEFALAKDQIVPSTYNSGVIVFKKNHPLLQEWASRSEEQNGLYRGDQDLLSQIIADRGGVCELPQSYNWNVGFGLRAETVIYHWLGETAKAALRNQQILQDL